MNKIQAAILALACSVGIPASAASIAVTYSFDGGPVGPEVPIGTILTVDHFSTGAVLSANPSLNAIWNPVTYLSHDVIDLTTGLLNGAFTMTFADGNTLSGNLFVDLSQAFVNGVGPTPQTFTFTSGTGEFAGATGLFSGTGHIVGNGFTISGSGTINAPAIVPEPASAALLMGGLALVLGSSRRSKMSRTNAMKSDGGFEPHRPGAAGGIRRIRPLHL
jgi:hypothetical protein